MSAAIPAPAVTRCGWLAYGVAALTVGLDQLSKAWVVGVLDLPARGSMHVAPLLSFSMEWNRGVSYGLLTAHSDLARWALVAFSLLVAGALAWWARRSLRALPAAATGLIVGGAVGNAIDRARFGQVADFIDASALHFPWIFNLADSAISVGVAALVIDSLWLGGRRRG